MELHKRYDFKESEIKWKKYWEKNKIYKFNLKSKGFLIWLITIGLKKPLITIGIKKKHEILNKKK